MTSLSAKDKFLGEDALVLNQRHFGLKPTGAFFYKKATYIMQFYTESAYFSAYYCVFFCSLISSLLVFELFSPIVILKNRTFR